MTVTFAYLTSTVATATGGLFSGGSVSGGSVSSGSSMHAVKSIHRQITDKITRAGKRLFGLGDFFFIFFTLLSFY
jgi:hypothetical protein